jgi:uncharacterized protein YegP (UPF0339 family)
MATKRTLKFRIHKSDDNQFYSTIVGTNGQVLFTSETYKTKKGCVKTCMRTKFLMEDAVIESVKVHAKNV